MSNPYKCPSCSAEPLRVVEAEIDPDVSDHVLHCEACGRHFQIIPGKELKI